MVGYSPGVDIGGKKCYNKYGKAVEEIWRVILQLKP